MNQLNLFWETWVDVDYFDGLYQVNGHGYVKSLNYNKTGKEKILKPFKSNGYLRVTLSQNGKKTQPYVHQLVAKAFYGDCPEGYEVDHFDFNPENNTVENLRYIPAKENHQRHSDESKRKNIEKIKNVCSKPVLQYTIDGEFIKEWPSSREIERELGFANTHISDCCLSKRKSAYGFIWRHKEVA